MGAKVDNYCDGCGSSVGEARVGIEVLQAVTVGSNGNPVILLLCLDREPLPVDPEDPTYSERANRARNEGKIRGCARKVLTKSVLAKLYEEVAEYTGNPDAQPFAL